MVERRIDPSDIASSVAIALVCICALCLVEMACGVRRPSLKFRHQPVQGTKRSALMKMPVKK